MFATDEQTEAASEILFQPRVQSSEAGADHTQQQSGGNVAIFKLYNK